MVPPAKSAALAILMIRRMKLPHLEKQFALSPNSGSNKKDQIPSYRAVRKGARP